MLAVWLGSQRREAGRFQRFGVVDIEEFCDLSSEVEAHLIDLLRSARFDREFLADMAKIIGWEDVSDAILARNIPTTTKIRRGDFGEALATALLEQFEGYVIPVPKLRYRVTPTQSLTGTDALALRVDPSGAIVEMCFVESKLRTVRDLSAGVAGSSQLAADLDSKLPDILTFTAQRLFERAHPLYGPFRQYLLDRRDTSDRDTARLVLCFDSEHWDERVLDNLEEHEPALPRLVVHAARIREVKVLTERLFAAFHITEITDDD